jgi:hypothetical protein
LDFGRSHNEEWSHHPKKRIALGITWAETLERNASENDAQAKMILQSLRDQNGSRNALNQFLVYFDIRGKISKSARQKRRRELEKLNMTEEERAAKREVANETQKRRRQLARANMTEEEKGKRRLATNAAQTRRRQLARMTMSPDELAQRRAAANAARNRRRQIAKANMTEEEIATRRAAANAAQSRRRDAAKVPFVHEELVHEELVHEELELDERRSVAPFARKQQRHMGYRSEEDYELQMKDAAQGLSFLRSAPSASGTA